MKELSLERMEEMDGGGAWDCAGAAAGAFIIVLGIAFLPVGGATLIAAGASNWTTSFFTGVSSAKCYDEWE